MTTLTGRTLLMSGGSRGIGLAIALRAARDRARIVMLAKTSEPHPRLPGTVHTAVAQVEEAGGVVGPAVVGDVRRDQDVARAVDAAVERFGGVDVVVNNASALDLRPTRQIEMKTYDLMQDINARGTFLLSKLAIPFGAERQGARPDVVPAARPAAAVGRLHLAYTMAKYAMSLVTLGLAEELREAGIAVNSLWPRTTIATAAVANLLGGDGTVSRSRTPEIVADAAHAILVRDSRTCTGNFFIDEAVLAEDGVTDLDRYRVIPGGPPLEADLFLDPVEDPR